MVSFQSEGERERRLSTISKVTEGQRDYMMNKGCVNPSASSCFKHVSALFGTRFVGLLVRGAGHD